MQTPEEIEAVKENVKAILSITDPLQAKIEAQRTQIDVALAYLKSGKPEAAMIVLAGGKVQ